MLKKVGIIAAAATAGVLAMSSLAFADTKKDDVTNDCRFGNTSGDASQTLTGSDNPLAGVIDALTGTATNAATQANTANCTNVNTVDVLDADSNNNDKTYTHTKVEHSFND